MPEIKQADEAPPDIDVKKAVQIALKYFDELFPNLRHGNVLLEEVEVSDDGLYWLITIGFDRPQNLTHLQAIVLQSQGKIQMERHFKTVQVDIKTGKVRSMKVKLIRP
jgi:hypothetical protein